MTTRNQIKDKYSIGSYSNYEKEKSNNNLFKEEKLRYKEKIIESDFDKIVIKSVREKVRRFDEDQEIHKKNLLITEPLSNTNLISSNETKSIKNNENKENSKNNIFCIALESTFESKKFIYINLFEPIDKKCFIKNS